MYSKLITPQSRTLYHGGLSGGHGRAVRCRCHSNAPSPTPSDAEYAAACSEVTASRQSAAELPGRRY